MQNIIIKKQTRLLSLDLGEVWRYRYLLYLFVRRDFVSKYKQTLLGPFWFVFQPLVTTVVFTLVFNRVAKISTDGISPGLFYLTGLLTWGLFSQGLNSTSSSLRNNVGILSKVYFPRLVGPLASMSSAYIPFLLQFSLWFVVFFYYKYLLGVQNLELSFFILFMPLLALYTGWIALGFGLFFAALTAKYRDLVHALGFVSQIWLYATPIIYPFSEVPEKWQWITALNPMTAVVELSRQLMLGQSSFTIQLGINSVVISTIVLVTSLLYFNIVQRRFVDTV